MSKMLIYCFYLSALFSCSTKEIAKDLSSKKCGTNYCLYEFGPKSGGTVIFFPGLLDTKKALEKSFFDNSDVVVLAEKLKSGAVLIISKATILSPAWFLKSPSDIEKTILALEVANKLKRPFLCVGHSMGGFNLLELVSQVPKLCQKVVLVNPMLLASEVDPFKLKDGVSYIIEQNYSKKEWLKLKPQILLEKAKEMPPVLFSSCKKDIFKLQPGAQSAYGVMIVKGFISEFVDQGPDCDHTTFPENTIYEFLK